MQYESITTADVLHLPDDSPLRVARDARRADQMMPDRHVDSIRGLVASNTDSSLPGTAISGLSAHRVVAPQ